jgi:hypothetical protein
VWARDVDGELVVVLCARLLTAGARLLTASVGMVLDGADDGYPPLAALPVLRAPNGTDRP